MENIIKRNECCYMIIIVCYTVVGCRPVTVCIKIVLNLLLLSGVLSDEKSALMQNRTSNLFHLTIEHELDYQNVQILVNFVLIVQIMML